MATPVVAFARTMLVVWAPPLSVVMSAESLLPAGSANAPTRSAAAAMSAAVA